MMKAFKRAFGRITPAQQAADELQEAERALLAAQTGAEWATSQVTYNQQRVKRLKKVLADMSQQTEEAVPA